MFTPIRMGRNSSATVAAALLLAACSRPAPSTDAARESPRSQPVQADSTPGFANKAWKVGKSSAVEPGTIYVFLSDGTLLITSSHSTPSLGRWHYAADTLTLIEEGIAYPAIMLRQGVKEMTIRIQGPGEPIEITFVPAAPTQ